MADEAKSGFLNELVKLTVARIKFGSILSIVLFSIFGLLDWVLFRDKYLMLWGLRLFCALCMGIIYYLVHTYFGKRHAFALGIISAQIFAVAISVMVMITGGHKSIYYAGMITIVLVMCILFPWRVKESLITFAFVYLIYIVPIILFDKIIDKGTFISNNFFLVCSMIFATISTRITYRLRLTEYLAQQRVKQELELGRSIQTGLLPRDHPGKKGLRISGFMQPAVEIGGDYYDIIDIQGKNSIAVVIGDVSGKGVGAGLLMAMVKTAVFIYTEKGISPRNILIHINELINRHLSGEKFMTLLYMLWNSDKSCLTYSSAGHEHILIFRAASKEIEVIPAGGIILGVMKDIDAKLNETEIRMSPGDKLLLYTDGITDAHNANRERFGLERLQRSFLSHSSRSGHEIMNALKTEVLHFIGSYPQYDDITLVILEAEYKERCG